MTDEHPWPPPELLEGMVCDENGQHLRPATRREVVAKRNEYAAELRETGFDDIAAQVAPTIWERLRARFRP
jgi:hypothetical protein